MVSDILFKGFCIVNVSIAVDDKLYGSISDLDNAQVFIAHSPS
jgi:hypothetical protein